MPNLNDPFVRKWVGGVLFALAVVIVLPAVLGSLVAIDYLIWPEKSGNKTLASIVGFFPSPEQPKVKELLDIFHVFIAALPALLIAVAVEKQAPPADQQKLNAMGRTLAIFFTAGIVLGIFASIAISPEDWASDHELEQEGLQRLLELVRGSLQASVFYLALLFGLRSVK